MKPAFLKPLRSRVLVAYGLLTMGTYHPQSRRRER
jgi:hypothetical protein